MTSTPEWCKTVKPVDPNDVGPQTPFIIRPLYRVVGARLHCWISFSLIGLMFLFNYCVAWFRTRVLHQTLEDDFKDLKGFDAFWQKWFYGPISDGWNRPIRGPPAKFIEVIPRKRYVKDRVRVAHVPDMDAPTMRTLNLGSYNYLGYGGVFPGITEKLVDCIDRSGLSLCTTPAELGVCAEQRRAEEAIAHFMGKEDAIAFPMGFATNSLVIPALVGREGLVISDELNHASIITGIRRTGAAVRVFRHNDMAELEELLAAATSPREAGRWSRILIVVEGLYSMEGELCPLREIVELKDRYGALLYIDEAHSVGALGPTGRGICEYWGISPRHVDVLMGTFTKSFSSAGGYIASDKDTIAHLRKTAPGWAYGSSMSPACAQQVVLALEHLQSPAGKELINRLRDNSIRFRRQMLAAHLSILGPPDTPVVPQMIRHPAKLPVFSRTLLKQGVATVVVGYPATPVTGLRARFCISGAINAAEIDDAVGKIVKVSQDLCVDFLTPAQSRAALEETDRFLAAPRSCELPDATYVDASTRPYTSKPLGPAGEAGRESAEKRCTRVVESALKPREAVVLSSTDYLGLANCPEAMSAAKETVLAYGCGACGPRGFYGTTDKHLELEDCVARWMGAESAIVYSYGALVATSVVSTYANMPDDLVLYDEGVSYSAQVGIAIAHGRAFPYAHCDASSLERLARTLKRLREFKAGRVFILTEGVFANTGDVAPLPALVAAKRRLGATLIVDETHSLGTLGSTGRGLREYWAEATGDSTLLEREAVDLIVGSLETAIGSVGGFCCGPRPLIQFQVLAGLGYVFSASAPPFLCAAATAAIEALRACPHDYVSRLHENTAYARASAAKRLGAAYDVSGNDPSSPLFLLSLRKRGAAWPEREAEERVLEEVCRRCSADGSCAVCLSRHIAADTAAPRRPSLRVCVSAKYPAYVYDGAFDAIAHHTADVLAELKL